MSKNNLLKLNLQHFAETFDPANVMMQDMKTGEIPAEYGTGIIQNVMENSKMMQLARFEEMTKQRKVFDYLAKGPGAYWVGEGERIQTSKAEWLQVEMVAKKVAVIMPASREFLQYTMPQFFAEMQPKMAEAFYQKIDAATILNVQNPFSFSIDGSIVNRDAAEGDPKVITGDLTAENIIELQGLVEEDDFDTNAFISKRQNRTALRGALDVQGQYIYDRNANSLDGQPVIDLKSTDMPKGRLYAGDFNQLRYGIPFGINYQISEDAQLSTLTASDGKPVNLFEQELIAVRATMDVAFMVVQDNAFAKIEPAPEV